MIVPEMQISESIELYEHLFQQMAEGLLLIDEDHIVNYSNPYVERILGYSSDELPGKHILEIIPDKHKSTISVILKGIFNKRVIENKKMIVPGLKKDGSGIFLEISISQYQKQDATKMAVVLAYDVTRQIKEKELLDQKKKLYKSVLEGLIDGVVSFDNDLKCVFVNDIAMSMFNQSSKESFLKKSFIDFFLPIKNKSEMNALLAKIHKKEPAYIEMHLPSVNKWIDARTCYHYNGFALFMRDITEIIEKNEMLKKSEERFSKSFQSSPIAQMITHAETKVITDVNDKFLKLIDFKREKLIGESYKNFYKHLNIRISPESDKKRIENESELFPPEDLVNNQNNNESTLFNRQGTPIPILYASEPIVLNNEAHVLTTIVDFREKKKAEMKLHQINDDLESMVNERTVELLNSLEYEKELNELKSRFVTMASHEFRTPISTILSSIELIEKYMEKADQASQQKHIKRIKSSLYGLIDLLNEFLSLEKLEQNKIEVRKETFNLYQCLQEIIEEMNETVKDGQRLILSHEGDPMITQDKRIIRNILLNLISNAIKYSPENSNIEIDLSVFENHSKISIKDYGIGIPEEEQKNIFTRLFRAKNATNIQGSGLGLNIVKKYLDLIDGRIHFSSETGKGSTFTVYFD